MITDPLPNSTHRKIRVFLGGSFDPVHLGHLSILDHVYATLRQPIPHEVIDDSNNLNYRSHNNDHPFITACFLPATRSPFKTHTTSIEHRLNMLTLSCENTPFEVCTLEINRAPPSYTIDTLRVLRQSYPADSLIFVIGADNVASLSEWREGLNLTSYCHLWILPRALPIPKWHSIDDVRSDLPASLRPSVTTDINNLKSHRYGCIYIQAPLINDTDQSNLVNKPISTKPLANTDLRPVIAQVSSSQIRQCITDNKWQQVQSALLPQVYQYIRQHNLYR